jgi:hypothetical protein
MLPNWWLSVLLGLLIFTANAPSFNVQQRIAAKTEQQEGVRSLRTSTVLFQKLFHSTPQFGVSKNRFLSVLNCSTHIQIKIKSQSKQIFRFNPSTFCWAPKVGPRMSLDAHLPNQG